MAWLTSAKLCWLINTPTKKEDTDMTEETKMILEELKKLNNKITDIQLTLENETNKNIKIIAEGHLDLSRKLKMN